MLLDTFTTWTEQYRDRVGQPFTYLGLVDLNGYDWDEVGPLFSIRFADGNEAHAFPEEIFSEDDDDESHPLPASVAQDHPAIFARLQAIYGELPLR